MSWTNRWPSYVYNSDEVQWIKVLSELKPYTKKPQDALTTLPNSQLLQWRIQVERTQYNGTDVTAVAAPTHWCPFHETWHGDVVSSPHVLTLACKMVQYLAPGAPSPQSFSPLPVFLVSTCSAHPDLLSVPQSHLRACTLSCCLHCPPLLSASSVGSSLSCLSPTWWTVHPEKQTSLCSPHHHISGIQDSIWYIV